MLEAPGMLFGFEREALIEALRRDIRSELAKAESSRACRELHLSNARHSARLLEIFSPRHPRQPFLAGQAPLHQ